MVCSVPATGSTGVADFLKNPGLGYGWRLFSPARTVR